LAVLLDTSLLVAIERGDAPLDAVEADAYAISVITVSELLHGVYRARPAQRTRRRLVVERLLALFDALPVTEEIARVHAEIGADLAAAGPPVTGNDLWIGATALVHDLSVATRDQRSFGRIAGLHVVAG
jgi:tRNA(fMet)-specific endonuclease VapC